MKPGEAIWTAERIIASLRDPACYPHPVEAVRVVQTHASCVFLTGDDVYKVKKPVNFGFLDYGTPERRRHFCEREMELNRRLCPTVYREVVPLTVQAGRLRVGGEGVPVEWAVRMRQLRDADMLATRLQTGRLDHAQIERIAVILADFHARARAGPAIQAFGRPALVGGTVTDALGVMDRLASAAGGLSAPTRRDIRRSFTTFLGQADAVFVRRMQRGAIRDCHGDLRAQNICLDGRYEGGVQIFDCIEFNDAFRYIDCAADLAYLAMDLDLAGRADLRERLVETYRGASGDNGLADVLALYQTYRAVVRGNIALLAAGEGEIEETERAAQREVAAAAYDLARGYARRRDRPALLITVGFSGAGKSSLARELCRRLPAVLISSDHVRKEQAGVPVTEPLGPAHYAAASKAAIYAELRRRAAEYLARGEHVLLDATFLSARERGAAADLAHTHAAEFWVLECRCPGAVLRERLAARRGPADGSDAGPALYEEQARSRDPVTAAERGGGRYVTVGTERPLPSTVSDVFGRFVTALDKGNRRKQW